MNFTRSLDKNERADLIILSSIAAMFLIGITLCHFSFQQDKLVFTKVNLIGLVIMHFIPQVLAIITMLGRNLYDHGYRQYCQAAVEKFGGYTFFSTIAAVYFSNGQGFITTMMVVDLIFAWVALMIAAFVINNAWRKRLIG
ncbi:MAG: hypothetical protein WCX71_04685 [Candidatus Buchananbacteria bacterium]